MSQRPDPAAPLLDLDDDELASLIDGPAYRLRQLRRWLYEAVETNVDAMTDLPDSLRAELAQRGVGSLDVLSERSGDDGMTVKWLFDSRGAQIETVLMRYPDRSTVCVSSQAGCAQGCPFCATGQGGFERNLSVGEIVEQVLVAERYCRRLTGDDAARSTLRVSNVVFMGMGEPLANYRAVVAAIGRLNRDCGIGARSITVSTIGVPDRMRSLGVEAGQVTLAVSLHAPDDDLRNRLVPPNRRWPIRAVLEALADYRRTGGRRATIEYTLMDRVNDRPDHATRLADLVRPLGVHVNLIPMNPTGDPAYRAPRAAAVERFAEILTDAGVNATVRHNRGTDIDGACGQLRNRRGNQLLLGDSTPTSSK